jgi:undecaprenyl phosphate N,N'-diacetylbacillosamine 1-phosphate transferase
MYKPFFKRFFDFWFGLIVLFILSPIFVLVIIALFFANNGKPFFLQTRPGKNERLFKIIKFKTMNDKKDADGHLLSDEKRLTRIGAFVRKTSLDELPQLLNVVVGDMSLIGPRPLLVDYLSLYSEFQKQRHSIKPGITGWAQVNGRNTISWEKKFEYDVWYVKNCSISLDSKIVFLTLKKVFKSEGISQEGQATMKAFKGNI